MFAPGDASFLATPTPMLRRRDAQVINAVLLARGNFPYGQGRGVTVRKWAGKLCS